jgi:transposase-like protein
MVCLVILWRFRYRLSLRDLVEMFFQRGVIFTHAAVQDWGSKLAPLLSETLCKRRHSRVRFERFRSRVASRGGQLTPPLTVPHHHATSLHEDCPHVGPPLSF